MTLPSYMHLHPMVNHFPIALFITALGFDILSFILKKESLHRTALQIYIVAALVTPLVIRTGLWEEERLHLNHPILDQHRLYAYILMWVSLASLPLLWLIKQEFRKFFRIVFFIFLISAATFVSLAGDKGGRMVYEYGAGVEK